MVAEFLLGERIQLLHADDGHVIGPAFFARLLKGMTAWMEAKGYTSVAQMRGSMSQQSVKDSTAFVRGNYIKVLESYTNSRAKAKPASG